MTDLSQAIVNGFAIADTIKSRREQEKQNTLAESYRRDTFAENKRQFNLGLAEKQADRVQQGDQFGRTLAQRESESKDFRDISNRRLDLTQRSLTNEEKRQRYSEDQDTQKRHDAMASAIGGQITNLSGTGFPDAGVQTLVDTLFANPDQLNSLVQEMYPGQNPLKSVKDGTPFNRGIVKDGYLVLYGTRKKPDGTYEAAIPDEGRTADNSTPPMKIPVAKVIQAVTAHWGGNPYFISAASEGQLFAGMRRPEGPAPTEDVRTSIIERAEQSTTAASQPQPTAGAPTLADPAQAPARSAAPTTSPAPAPVTTSGLSPDESAELEKLNQLRLDTARGAAPRGEHASLIELGSKLEPRRQELLAKQQAAEEAAKQDAQSLAVSQAASARGLAVPPAPASDRSATNQQQDPSARAPREDPSAEMYRQNKAYNDQLNLMFTARKTLGTDFSSADVAAFGLTGVPSSALLKESDDAAKEQQKRIDEGGANLDRIIGSLSEGDKFMKERVGEMRDVAGLVNQMTYGAVGANEPMARNVSSNLIKLTRMRDNIPGIGIGDPYARPIMSGIALANANASAVSDEQRVVQAERVADAYSSLEKKPSEVQAALIAKLAISGATPQEHKERFGWIMGLTPAQQARALRELLQ